MPLFETIVDAKKSTTPCFLSVRSGDPKLMAALERLNGQVAAERDRKARRGAPRGARRDDPYRGGLGRLERRDDPGPPGLQEHLDRRDGRGRRLPAHRFQEVQRRRRQGPAACT